MVEFPTPDSQDEVDFLDAVHHGIDQADAGQLIPHAELVARIEALLQKTQFPGER